MVIFQKVLLWKCLSWRCGVSLHHGQRCISEPNQPPLLNHAFPSSHPNLHWQFLKLLAYLPLKIHSGTQEPVLLQVGCTAFLPPEIISCGLSSLVVAGCPHTVKIRVPGIQIWPRNSNSSKCESLQLFLNMYKRALLIKNAPASFLQTKGWKSLHPWRLVSSCTRI